MGRALVGHAFGLSGSAHIVLYLSAVELRDDKRKRSRVVVTYLLDRRSVKDDGVTADARDARPMHRGESRRTVPRMRERGSPLRGRLSTQLDRHAVERAAAAPVVARTADMFGINANDLDRFERFSRHAHTPQLETRSYAYLTTDSGEPRKVFADGIVSDHSHLDAGLQLADFVAHVIWSVIRNPGDAASDVWALLARRVMPTPEGPPIKVWAWPAENLPEDDVRPYERLAELAPQTLYSGG